MGASVSTLVGWAVVIGVAYVFVVGVPGKKKARDVLRGASQRQRLEDRQASQNRKEPKEKAKRQRVETHSKDAEEADKAAQSKARPSKPQTTGQSVDYSTDEGVDNREFARQLASVKQGTSLNAPKKSDEKRQKSVKQSRAQIIDERPSETKVSAPSSTAGVDADDDESSTPSPEIKPIDAGDVSDMLEPKAPGPSVLRLTDTDKVKQKKEKKAKTPEKVETKKQRQNRQKAEAAKALREETEKQRKIDMEAQRRQARIAEGRPAKDGSAFVAAQAPPQSVWTGNGAKGSPDSSATNGEYVPVQPLDTFDTSSYTDVSAPKRANAAQTTADSWMASLPSEEEQMEMLRSEEAWNTVKTKKSAKKKKEATTTTAESPVDSEPTTVVQSQPVPPQPRPAINGATGKAGKPIISQQSAFAALSTNDEPEVETEWDV